MIERRFPHQVGKGIAKEINAGRLDFADTHLSKFPQDLQYGYYSLAKKGGDRTKPLDWAIVEATEVLEDGSIVPASLRHAMPLEPCSSFYSAGGVRRRYSRDPRLR